MFPKTKCCLQAVIDSVELECCCCVAYVNNKSVTHYDNEHLFTSFIVSCDLFSNLCLYVLWFQYASDSSSENIFLIPFSAQFCNFMSSFQLGSVMHHPFVWIIPCRLVSCLSPNTDYLWHVKKIKKTVLQSVYQ